MPTLSHVKLPVPRSWDELEDIVVSAILGQSPSVSPQRFGRQGQQQNGVDILYEDFSCRLTGVQCKLVTDLTIKQISAEVDEAEKFRPELEAYIVAASVPRDAPLQKLVYDLSAKRAASGKFRLGIWFWEDISFFLSRDPIELARHYPQLFGSSSHPVAPVAGVATQLLQRQVKAYEELWVFHHRCLPERNSPDMEWNDALEEIALSLDSHTKALRDLLLRIGAILPIEVVDLLKIAQNAAEEGAFEIGVYDSFKVSQSARDAAERMYESVSGAVRLTRESLELAGVRF